MCVCVCVCVVCVCARARACVRAFVHTDARARTYQIHESYRLEYNNNNKTFGINYLIEITMH